MPSDKTAWNYFYKASFFHLVLLLGIICLNAPQMFAQKLDLADDRLLFLPILATFPLDPPPQKSPATSSGMLEMTKLPSLLVLFKLIAPLFLQDPNSPLRSFLQLPLLVRTTVPRSPLSGLLPPLPPKLSAPSKDPCLFLRNLREEDSRSDLPMEV